MEVPLLSGDPLNEKLSGVRRTFDECSLCSSLAWFWECTVITDTQGINGGLNYECLFGVGR